MSELKVIKIELNNHGKPIASIQGTTSYYGISPNDTFYPKSEADKVIVELQSKISLASLAEDCSRLRHKRCNYCSELQRQKYKRCMAMMKYCEYRFMNLEKMIDTEYRTKKMRLSHRWWVKWLKLADKFKEDIK